MSDLNTSDQPSWLELESVRPLAEASKRTSLSPDTLSRHYREYVIDLSPRRRGMQLKHILAIAAGTLTATKKRKAR